MYLNKRPSFKLDRMFSNKRLSLCWSWIKSLYKNHFLTHKYDMLFWRMYVHYEVIFQKCVRKFMLKNYWQNELDLAYKRLRFFFGRHACKFHQQNSINFIQHVKINPFCQWLSFYKIFYSQLCKAMFTRKLRRMYLFN